jgi:MOSC domain-containing protein YiiM
MLLEVTRYTSPCVNIAAAFAGRDFARVPQKRHPGFSRVYAGTIATGDAVELLHPEAAASRPAP